MERAAHELGLDTDGLRLLHQHATAVYLLPATDAVARVHTGDPAAAVRSVTIANWLTDQGFPATTPLPGSRPITYDRLTVSFWTHYQQTDPPPQPDPAELGRLLRELHRLPPPPVILPVYRPLASLHAVINTSVCLTPDDRAWLTDTAATLLAGYAELDFPLGHGHLHGDAYPGNLLLDARTGQWRLGDWDETAAGPRELDLANTYQGIRMGRTTAELDRFAQAYGYDLRDWTGLPTLRSLRDLHTLGSFIRRADRGDSEAAAVLRHRLHVLRQGEATLTWHGA
ncbi:MULTISPECIES: phosphotransferase family protein [Saccharothrix]|uniref:phosphotransferase family protein n=1 Tax=Saccharothrix TaxID=2071 RepID=UPI000AB972FA|nr:phosphotransferase [Saccharothrix sp. CB00851]